MSPSLRSQPANDLSDPAAESFPLEGAVSWSHCCQALPETQQGALRTMEPGKGKFPLEVDWIRKTAWTKALPAPDSVSCSLHNGDDPLLSTYYVSQPNKLRTIIIPILQIRKLGLQEVKLFTVPPSKSWHQNSTEQAWLEGPLVSGPHCSPSPALFNDLGPNMSSVKHVFCLTQSSETLTKRFSPLHITLRIPTHSRRLMCAGPRMLAMRLCKPGQKVPSLILSFYR